jgi:hypothetical protein
MLAAIPTRSNWQGLRPLLAHLASLGIDTVVYDNGHETDEGRAVLADHRRVVDATGWRFYSMWNHAWATAATNGYTAVALLNDDITLHDRSLEVAYTHLADERVGIVGLNYGRRVAEGADHDAGSRVVSGSYRLHGIGGHAFVLRSALWGEVPPIDERYFLWYGDDHLFASVERAGYVLKIALGAPVDHEESTTVNKHPELLARTGEDAELFRSYFG